MYLQLRNQLFQKLIILGAYTILQQKALSHNKYYNNIMNVKKNRSRKKTILVKKKYYGKKKGKVIPIYGHKIQKRIGRHKFYILWKTTKKNLPGKTYYGKFYKTRKAALKKEK